MKLKTYACTKFLHESEVSAVNPVTTLTNNVRLHELINLKCSVFCKVFLELRKFCQRYDDSGEH
jgi:hypothetical protein